MKLSLALTTLLLLTACQCPVHRTPTVALRYCPMDQEVEVYRHGFGMGPYARTVVTVPARTWVYEVAR